MERRTFLFADQMLGNLVRVVQDLREVEGNNLLGVEVSAACFIADVLDAAGVPLQGIRLVLGPEMPELYTAEDLAASEPMHCYQCEKDANKLVSIGQDKAGREMWRLACDHHALRAEAVGMVVVNANESR